ncbi:hypothetical protein QJS04_geneDACA020734 [Acorus gramineus]|uniref:Uncharacterized protein n=1 Tax=Acorus gramineus TaxID=55184 RepID=A0AAV9A0D2_ACOGR|nr:hypothetical protein QJS04_geneDACA020734 [Acorus gramineus]
MGEGEGVVVRRSTNHWIMLLCLRDWINNGIVVNIVCDAWVVPFTERVAHPSHNIFYSVI